MLALSPFQSIIAFTLTINIHMKILAEVISGVKYNYYGCNAQLYIPILGWRCCENLNLIFEACGLI